MIILNFVKYPEVYSVVLQSRRIPCPNPNKKKSAFGENCSMVTTSFAKTWAWNRVVAEVAYRKFNLMKTANALNVGCLKRKPISQKTKIKGFSK